MKIIITLVGIYRGIELNIFKKNVEHLKSQFKKQDYEIYFFTWELNNIELVMYIKQCGIHYFPYQTFNDYDMLGTIPNFQNKPKTKYYNYFENGRKPNGSYLNIYYMYYLIQKAASELYKRYPNSYIFLLRPDLHIDFINIENWIKKDTYHVPTKRAWREGNAENKQISQSNGCYNKSHNPITDIMGVGTIETMNKIYNMNDDTIYKLIQSTHNAESSLYKRINDCGIPIKYHKEISQDKLWLFSNN